MTILENTILCAYEGCSGDLLQSVYPHKAASYFNAEYTIDTMLILVLFSLDLQQESR